MTIQLHNRYMNEVRSVGSGTGPADRLVGVRCALANGRSHVSSISREQRTVLAAVSPPWNSESPFTSFLCIVQSHCLKHCFFTLPLSPGSALPTYIFHSSPPLPQAHQHTCICIYATDYTCKPININSNITYPKHTCPKDNAYHQRSWRQDRRYLVRPGNPAHPEGVEKVSRYD